MTPGFHGSLHRQLDQHLSEIGPAARRREPVGAPGHVVVAWPRVRCLAAPPAYVARVVAVTVTVAVVVVTTTS